MYIKQTYRKIIVFLLVMGIFINCIEIKSSKAGEQDFTYVENEDLDYLVMEKNKIKFILSTMKDSPEKVELQTEYEGLCKILKEKGVTNYISENINESNKNISIHQAPVPDLNTLLSCYYDLDTYYQYVTIDGIKYTLYKVVLTDKKELGFRNLSYVYDGQIILKGNISNDNDYLQFMTDVVKFSAGIATGGISNFVLGAAVSEVINAIPETEDYNVIHGQNVLCANSIGVNESVMYIYGYDAEYDRWIQICSRNYGYVNYNLVLTYKDSHNRIKNVSLSNCHTSIVPDRGGRTQKELVQHMMLMSKDPSRYHMLDFISTEFSCSLSKSSSLKTVFKFHGNALPTFMF